MMVCMPVIMDSNDRLHCGDSASLRALECERIVIEFEPPEYVTDEQWICACIDEGTEKHVAGHTGTAVEPGDVHGVGALADDLTIRATAHAAPYPLSMPTTVTPFAHVACIASSAVTPSRPAP